MNSSVHSVEKTNKQNNKNNNRNIARTLLTLKSTTMRVRMGSTINAEVDHYEGQDAGDS